MSYCREIRSVDPLAEGLCELLVDRGYSFADIDTGLEGVAFDPPAGTCAPDGVLQAQEVYHKSIQLMERDIASIDGYAPVKEAELFINEAWGLGFRPPWFIYDGDPENDADIILRGAIRERADGASGLGTVEAAKYIRDWIFSPDGLDIQILDNISYELDSLSAIRRGTADCTESSRILYSAYRYAGLNPEFVWVRRDPDGEPILHMAVKVQAESSDVVVDTKFGIHSDLASVATVPPLAAMAVYEENVGNKELDDLAAYHHFIRALLFDPSFPLTYIYLSLPDFLGMMCAQENGCLDEARRLDSDADSYIDLILP